MTKYIGGSKTFQYQDQLKPLPVPHLRKALNKYMRSLRPIATDSELRTTLENVASFVKDAGVGIQLYNRLREYAQERYGAGSHWFEEWWLEYGYLRWRGPLPIDLSCYLCLLPEWIDAHTVTQTQQVLSEDLTTVESPTLITKAARFTVQFMAWKDALDRQEHPCERAGKSPLDMHQLNFNFTTVRHPGKEVDSITVYEPDMRAIVLVKNQVFDLDLETPDLLSSGRRLNASEIEYQLRVIQAEASKSPPAHGVGVFTTMGRTEWANIKEELEKDSNNKNNFDRINTSLFVISLDDHTPSTYNEEVRLAAACGTNRWYDKIYTLIVFANSKVSVNLEHTPCDAPSISGMCHWCCKNIRDGKIEVPILKDCSLPAPTKMEWKLEYSHFRTLEKADLAFTKWANSKCYEVLEWNDYGTIWCKKNKVSPDAYLQMVLQLAYFKLHRKGTPTYETGHTRKFFKGRTDTVRTFSIEALEFVQGMVDTRLSPSAKYLLFKRAMDVHLGYMKDVVSGQGCDRILLALQILHEKEIGGPLPAIFTDPLYAESKHYRLSTSNVPAPSCFGGFGNMYPDGYGACYILKNHQIHVTMCSDRSNPETNLPAFKESLRSSFAEMQQLIEHARRSKL